jgi:transcription-repair coupling factor (superfamily II helicase)
MRGFYQQRFNLLLCTTIIETGIDVPTANTILIHRSDKFGLAQLHQLRGRVGRSHHQAYAYLLVSSLEGLTSAAKKRLEAIQSMEELGSGFYLAMHDLEIRGAGEVLGDSQSGEMQEIGFSLYTEMLVHAVACLKVGKEPDLTEPLGVTTEINLHAPALLPDDYCGDVHERLVLYKRLANCQDPEHLNQLFEELVDRFGRLPEPAQTLVESHRLRIAAVAVGVAKIDAGPELVTIQFRKDAPIDAAKVIKLIQKDRNVQLAGQDKLRISVKTNTPAERAQAAKIALQAIRAT